VQCCFWYDTRKSVMNVHRWHWTNALYNAMSLLFCTPLLWNAFISWELSGIMSNICASTQKILFIYNHNHTVISVQGILYHQTEWNSTSLGKVIQKNQLDATIIYWSLRSDYRSINYTSQQDFGTQKVYCVSNVTFHAESKYATKIFPSPTVFVQWPF